MNNTYSSIDDSQKTSTKPIPMGSSDCPPEVAAFSHNVTEQKHSEDTLRESEKRFRMLFERMHEGFALCEIILDDNGKPCDWRYLEVNQAWEKHTGLAAYEVLGKTVREVLPNIEPRWIEAYGRVALTGQPTSLEDYVQDLNRYFQISAYSLAPGQFAVLFLDITARKHAEDALRDSEMRFRRTFDESPIGSAIVSLDYRFTRANAEMCRITGYSEDELKTLTFIDITHPDYRQEGIDHTEKLLVGEIDGYEMDKQYIRKDGGIIWGRLRVRLIRDAAGNPLYFLPMIENITDKKNHEKTLKHLAHHDQLTGLPNRLMFGERLSQRLEEARERNLPFAVLFVDLDRFKVINDTYGHNIGDLVLRRAATRLAEVVRGVDSVSRVGGDEFIVIVGDISSADDSEAVAQRMLHELTTPFDIDGHRLTVSASIGISMYPVHGSTAESLVQKADAAMYKAKQLGRNNYQLHADADALKCIVIEHDLGKALERNELLLHYQPRIDLTTGGILGAEALVRWRHPTRGIIPPGQFIPIAEESNLIDKITQWVLNEACSQNRAWSDSGLPHMDIAVNISASIFGRGNLCSMIAKVLELTCLAPGFLTLEISEDVFLDDCEMVARILHDLKALGLKISLDCLRIDSSSLSNLRGLPIDLLKIDMPFVDTALSTTVADVRAVINTAHGLGLRVAAKRVETVDQLRLLQALKCDEMQGYFVSPPIQPHEFAERLAKDHQDIRVAV